VIRHIPHLIDSLFGLSRRRERAGFLTLAVALPLTTAALTALRDSIHPATALVIFLLLVVLVSAIGGHRPAVLAAVASPQLVNWFLVKPYGSFRIDDRENMVSLAVFIAVALIVSWFVAEAARRGLEAQARAEVSARAEALHRADELRTAILRSVSHDLRTPLASIKAAASSLRASDVEWSDDDRSEFLRTIEEETDRLTSVVSDLLDLSRLQAGVLTPKLCAVSLEEVLPTALPTRHEPSAGRIVVDLPDDLPDISADPALMERVLANLVGNAVRHAPQDTEVIVAAAAHDGSVVLSIVDHGCGIPEADRQRVREPFQRLSDNMAQGGLGLGLSIVDGLVTAMHGTFELTDTPGGGLTASVTMPVHQAVPA